LRLTKLMDR